jgi:hypothetical protein
MTPPTHPARREPGPILDYRGGPEQPGAEPWWATAAFSVFACALVLAGVVVIVLKLLAYLFSAVQY